LFLGIFAPELRASLSAIATACLRAGPILGQQARPPVAGLSFAAARANPPQLLGRLVEEEVGKVGHGSPFGMTIHPVERLRSKRNRTHFGAFILCVFKNMQVSLPAWDV
jgi:hypothetical protein